jgi:hypothetical protein
LSGTFQALLATATASAASRFDTTGTPWLRPDGTGIFDPASNLANSVSPPAPINMTASGAYYMGSATWITTGATATNAVGTAATTCSSWTSSSSSENATTGIITAGPNAIDQVPNPCSYAGDLLYCLED